MKLSYRLTMMFASLSLIFGVGWFSTHSFQFATGQFWFISGALLLVMLSLVDQPHFSKDANVFVNGATALVSLFTIVEGERTGIWWIFCAWAMYLIVASFCLMSLRSRDLFLETKYVRFFSLVNRTIGRPEAVFSAFLLWGVFLQFSYPKDGLTINALLLFWATFMILNVPSIAQSVSVLLEPASSQSQVAGVITGIQSPSLAVVKLSPHLPDTIAGSTVRLTLDGGEQLAEGTLFDDRVVRGLRQGRIALTAFTPRWSEVGAGRQIRMVMPDLPAPAIKPVGVVSPGSSIGRLVFEVDPRVAMHAGEVVRVKAGLSETYYQAVSATIDQVGLEEGNVSQSVRVGAGLLGCWNAERCTFEPVDWVAPAGELVVVSAGEGIGGSLPEGRSLVGTVPSSKFPVHLDISDAVTHNTALIGVTGSGKSYLAFHLIEAYLDAGIRVLILDATRQHNEFLGHRNPTRLTGSDKVAAWLASDSLLAIHQFATPASLPLVTADFVQKTFDWLLAGTQLQAGVDPKARLCIVFEEAHSLVPEWNQVANDGDKNQVNRTARMILQGRKFGLGTLLITQRTANVTKSILNQCNTIFALRSFDQTGLEFLKSYMGDEHAHAISTLRDGTAILVGKASSSARPIIVQISDFGERWKGKQPLQPATVVDAHQAEGPSPGSPPEHDEPDL